MSRLRCGWLLVAVAMVLAPARAWIFLGGDLWRDGTIVFSFGETPFTPRTGLDWEGAVREAADAWNASLQRVRFELRPPGERTWYENNRNEVFFDRQVYDDPWPSGVLGVSFATHDRGVLIENDVVLNSNRNWSLYRGAWQPGAADFRRVVLHELGHVLGLDHPDEHAQTHAAIMNAQAGDRETLSDDDRAGARALYDFGPGAAPVIVVQPKTVSVVQGATARLNVLAGGRGPLRYEWRRAGVAVTGGTAERWEFTAGLGDDGEYTVVVRNEAGSVTSQPVRLNVSAARAPQVTVFSDSGQSVIEAGQDLTLRASLLAGDFPLRYEWRKNGVRLEVPDAASLALTDVQFSDAGDYTVTVSNVAGRATSAPVSVTVTPPPPLRFLRELGAHTVAPGGTLVLSAGVADTQAFRYQWQKDGADLPGATGSSLPLLSFKPSDVGSYAVVVSSPFGRISSPVGDVSLFDSSDFMIARQPGALTAFPGDSVSFTVGMSVPVTGYQWFKDGVPLNVAPPRSGIPSPTLTLPTIGPASAGVYSVEVSDGTRRVRSHGARLTVASLENSLVFTTHPAAHTVMLGDTVRLTAATRRPASLTWFKNGVPISSFHELNFVMKAEDAGRYRVRATDGVTTIDSDEVDVELVPARRLFIAHPAGRMYDVGSEDLRLVALTDEVARRRAVRAGELYAYARNGQPVDSPIADVTAPPARYTLTIGPPSAPETSRPFTVGFIGATGMPTILQHPRGGSVLVGEPILLEVNATPADVRYEWFKDGAALPATPSNRLSIITFSPSDIGNYTVRVRNGIGAVTSEPARLEIRGLDTPLIHTHPTSTTVVAGQHINLSVGTRRGEIRYQWFKDGVAIDGASQSNWSFVASAATAGAYSVRATDGPNTATSRPAVVRVLAVQRAPEILVQPAAAAAVLGGDVALAVSVDGAPLPTQYQWRKDGLAIPGGTDAKLKLHGVQADAAGVYSVVVSNAHGSKTSSPAEVTVDRRARLVNLATRANVGLGGDILIAGFTINGTSPREVLVRAIGDQLSEFGVSGVLRDPLLRIFDSTAKEMTRNDDWFRTNEAELERFRAAGRQVGAFAQRDDARDAAIIARLAPGSYTAQVSGLIETTGVGLVEIYELGKPAQGRMSNLSSRAIVGTDANVLIPGLVLVGEQPRRLLIRAVGPGLADFGVAGALADPLLTVFRGAERIAENDNWGAQQEAQLASAMAAVGAFPLKPGSRDAAIILDLAAGSYTVQVAGASRTTGTALVEVYELP